MHELSIAQSIVDVVSNHIDDQTVSRVSSVSVLIGEMSGVDAKLLEYAFPEAAQGTPLENAELFIETKPVSFACRACGESPIPPGNALCPQCGSREIELASGRELDILSFELFTPGEEQSVS